MEPRDVAVDDQLASYYVAHARRLAGFYRELRVGGVPAVVASIAVLVQQAGHHWPPSSST